VRCDPATEKTVLALAAQAWPESERAAYWKSIQALVRDGHAEQVVLLAGQEQNEVVAAQIAQSLSGRAAIVWPPQFADHAHAPRTTMATPLFARLWPELAAAGVELAQSLASASDPSTTQLLELGGLSHAADLLYLAAEVRAIDTPSGPLPFEMEPFTPEAAPRLAHLLERTYAASLDCPRIDGLRKTADVVAGYQSVGVFDPRLWQIARCSGADVGCLLMNLHPDVNHAEIVYLGLVPEVRGRGWGLLLTRRAQQLAREVNCDRVVLAVDAANEPAIRLYADAGFVQFDRRAIWIRSLVPTPKLLPDNHLSA
jgi:ribosomal protein S18 acetylase RimI-like enzyme